MGKCYFNPVWLKDERFIEWLGQVTNNPNVFFCRVCKQTGTIGSNGIKALTSHMKSDKHTKFLKAAKESQDMLSFMRSKTIDQPSVSSQSSHATASKASNFSSAEPCTSTAIGDNSCDAEITPSPMPIPPPGIRTLDAYVSNESTLKAEVRWVLHLVSSHSSSRSSDSTSELFESMFSDSQIARQFQCGRTKAGYLATFGVAPAVLDDIVNNVKESQFYTLMFDESYNSELELKQMDIHLRFVLNGLVNTKYYTSFFMGHAKAVDIEKNIKEAVSNINNSNLLQISMDGPNVNLKVFKDLAAEFEREQLNQLINIGTCGLHVLHNAFKDGLKATGWDLSSLLRSVYNLFQEAPARKSDYIEITGTTDLPLQFCGHRWLENLECAKRLISIWPAMNVYVKACKDGTSSEPLCKSYKVITDCTLDKLLLVKLHCFMDITKILQPFLEKYQSNDPLAPYLTTDLFQIIKRLCSLIMKDEYLHKLRMDGTLNPEKVSKESFKSHSTIVLGCLADQELTRLAKSKLVSERDALGIRIDFKKMCIKVISKIVLKSPIAFKVARDITCMDPDNFKKPEAPKQFHDLVKYLHSRRWLSADQVDDSLFQYRTLREAPQEEMSSSARLDEVYNAMKIETMPALKRVTEIVLTLSHGNAEVERGFSVNKEVSVENMAQKTLVAKRLICQFIRDNGRPAIVPLTKKMLSSCSGAYQRYKKALEDQRKEKEFGEQAATRKRKAEEVKEITSKRRKLELDIDILIKKADDLADEAEQKGSSHKAHDLLVQSNAMRKSAKSKKGELFVMDASIQTLEKELSLL